MAEETDSFRVVINHEEQYVVWPRDKRLPVGWKEFGRKGTRAECLKYIEEVWTDNRPTRRKPR